MIDDVKLLDVKLTDKGIMYTNENSLILHNWISNEIPDESKTLSADYRYILTKNFVVFIKDDSINATSLSEFS